MRDYRRARWLQALLHALPLMALVLALFYYWFAVVDRHLVFLYYHDMGPRVPSTSPFSRITASRYWMSGLVAGGFVMVLYVCANWLLGRLTRGYRASVWWRVWSVAAPVLFAAILLITMTANEPTLPLAHAVPTALVTVAAVALALMPGKMAAEGPRHLLLLFLDGSAMAAIVFALSMLERARWMLGRGLVWPMWVIGAALGGGVILLVIMTVLRAWWRTANSTAWQLFAAGLCVAYLLMPPLHHLGFTDGYYYISDADNFFFQTLDDSDPGLAADSRGGCGDDAIEGAPEHVAGRVRGRYEHGTGLGRGDAHFQRIVCSRQVLPFQCQGDEIVLRGGQGIDH